MATLTTWLAQLLPVRVGEGRTVILVGLIAVLYAAAVTVGDVVAQSVFVGRVGVESLPNIFLLKAAIDTLAALLYMPMTRRRHPIAVLRISFGLYVAVVVGGIAIIASTEGSWPAYALYVGHECAWTVLTIHWGVYLLEVFNASQARRLFPLLFGATRLGGVLAGVFIGVFATATGAVSLLWVCAALAVLAALATLGPGRASPRAAAPAQGEGPSETAVDDEAAHSQAGLPVQRSTLARWREAWRSPLVKAIAASTAIMVLVRYALRMVSMGHIENAFASDEDLIAEFLGWFDAFGNGIGAFIGVLVLPRLLSTFGVGAINAAYAVATTLAQGLLLMWPSLTTAAAARFVEMPLKDGIKTPLSALFYGGERPEGRGPARALVFGAVIPLATVSTAGLLTLARYSGNALSTATGIGLCAALVFVAVSLWLNRAWRAQLRRLLRFKLDTTRAEVDDELLERAHSSLAPYCDSLGADTVDRLARGLASRDQRLSALAEEVLAEKLPRQTAHQIAAFLRESQSRARALRDPQAPG